MLELQRAITDVADFPRRGFFSGILRLCCEITSRPRWRALDALLTEEEWSTIDLLAGIESRGFILGAALALRRRKGFVLVRKQGKLPAAGGRSGL